MCLLHECSGAVLRWARQSKGRAGLGGDRCSPPTTLNSPALSRSCRSEFGEDEEGMREQLEAAFPLNTYPQVAVTLDGGVIVSSGNLLVRRLSF